MDEGFSVMKETDIYEGDAYGHHPFSYEGDGYL